jgi:hypothetical protein
MRNVNQFKNAIILVFALTLSSVLNSCSKSNRISDSTTVTGSSNSLFERVLLGEQETDYTVLVSSSLGLSVLTPIDPNNTSTAIQAYSKEFSNNGEFSINGLNIPYQPSSNLYYFSSDEVNPSSFFQNKVLNCKLNNGSIYNFSERSNSQVIFTINNLVDKKILRNQDINISWKKNTFENSNREVIILLEGDKNTGDRVSEYITVQDQEENAVISNEIVAKFNDCNDLTISVARGNSKVISQNGRTIEFQDMNFSWSTVLFK